MNTHHPLSVRVRLVATLGWMWACVLVCLANVAHAEQAVCVKVKLEIPQTLTLERDAFDAKLALTNNLPDVPLTDLRVDLVFRASDGSDATELFFVQTPRLSQVTGAVDGTGQIAGGQRGEINWLLIPVPGAGGTLPWGRAYAVRAHIEYRAGGIVETFDTIEDTITVKPQPELELHYFLPRHVRGDDPFTPIVEPSIPFELGVRVHNVGYGTARALQIESAQPEIRENERGAIIDFRLVGTYRNDESIPPTLSIPFGDVEAQACAMGAWAMTTSLQGTFTALDVSFRHSDELGGEKTSLMRPARADFLVHRVLLDSQGRDGVFDALIDDQVSNDGLPERILESDCRETPVTSVSGSAVLRPDGTVLVRAPVSLGWNYARAVDPENGRYPVAGAVRVRDGKTLPALNAWGDVDDEGVAVVAVFDESLAGGVEGEWQLRYDRGDADVTPPVTTVEVLPPYVSQTPLLIGTNSAIVFSAQDDGSGVASTVVSIDGGAFELARTMVLTDAGLHTLRYRSTDRKGNVEELKTLSVRVDTAAPVVTLVSPAPGGRYGNDVRLGVSFSHADDDPDATVVGRIVPAGSEDPDRDGIVVRSGDALQPGQLAGGAYAVVFDVSDRLDHQGRVVGGTFTVEDMYSRGPTIVVTGVEDGHHYRTPVQPVVGFDGDRLDVTSVLINDVPFVSGGTFGAEGTHLLTARAVDAVGRTAAMSVLFTIDTMSPTITLGGVSDGEVVASPVAPFSDVVDAHLYDAVRTLDGAPWSDGPLVWGEGTHVYRVRALDLAGNESVVEARFTIDREPPRFIVEGASDGAVLSAPVALTVRAVDDALASSEVLLDGVELTPGQTVGRGTHVVTGAATDRFGRTSTLALTFTVDPEAPTITVSGVYPGMRVRGPVVPVVDVRDDTAVDVTVQLDGAPFSSGTSVSSDGQHTLAVRAVDAAGLESRDEVVFTLDARVPTLKVTGVEDGRIYRQPVTPFVVTDADSSLVLRLDGIPFASGTTVESEGNHALVAEATAAGAAGETLRTEVRFVIDRRPPLLDVYGVVDGGVYAEGVTPVLVADDDRLVSVSLTVDGAAHAESMPVTAVGGHVLEAVARDGAGNETRVELSFEIDPSVPRLVLEGPIDGSLVRAPTFVTAHVETVDGAAFDGTFSAELDGAAYVLGAPVASEGLHTVRVTATPPLGGRAAVAGVRFTADGTAPALAIEGVAEGAVTTSSVTLTLRASDVRLDAATVSFAIDGASVAVETSATTMARVTVDVEGEHVAEASAYDTVGNRGLARRTFAIDRTPPAIRIEGVQDGATVQPGVRPTVTVSDAHPATQRITLNGATFLSGTEVKSPGSYTLFVEATDAVGQRSERTVKFTVSSSRPRKTFVGRILTAGASTTDTSAYLHDEQGSYLGILGDVGKDGSVRFENVLPGRYRLRVERLWQRYLSGIIDLNEPRVGFTYTLPKVAVFNRQWHVDPDAEMGGDGSAAQPFSRIADALAVASWGDAVRLAGGRHVGPVTLKDGVTVQGGFHPDALTEDGSWSYDPAHQVSVLATEDPNAALVRATDVNTAVLADVTLQGGRLEIVESSVLVTDTIFRDGASAVVRGGKGTLLANVLVSGAPNPALRFVSAEATLASATVVDNVGVGASTVGGAVVVRASIFARNGGKNISGPLLKREDVLDDDSGAAPIFVSGPLHPYYLSQAAGGAWVESPGVDGATSPESAFDLRGRTTSVGSHPDEGALDLGFHAWPVEGGPGPEGRVGDDLNGTPGDAMVDRGVSNDRDSRVAARETADARGAVDVQTDTGISRDGSSPEDMNASGDGLAQETSRSGLGCASGEGASLFAFAAWIGVWRRRRHHI